MKKNIHLTVVGFLSLKLFFFLVIIFAGWLIFGIETNAFYYCLIGLFSLTIFWLILYKKKKLPEQTQSLIQFSLDIGVENLLIQFSGGLESPFIFLLILDIFLGAYLLPQKKILFVVAYASSFYAIFSTCAYLGLLPDMLTTENVFEISSDVYFYYVVYMRVFIFFMIGYLASQLSSRIFSQKATIERIQYFTEKILFQMKSGLISTDEEDRIIYANKAATDILNRDFSDLIGKPWQSFFLKKEDISSSEKQFNDDGSETEWQILHPDENDFIPVAITLSHFHDELDHIAGKTIMFRDLT
ncbi:MAG: PAS domain-containing protein, partial [Candidatus Aureabacteria bacterium]|nr:PAS domain-containing protein [Candidatus Auribacterota bacterium]